MENTITKNARCLTLSVYFQVSVSAWNEFAPQFVDVWYNASVLEERSPPIDVVTVSATDRDLGEASRVSFSLADDGSGSFGIHATTGRITTIKRLDYEKKAGYQLVVVATDNVSMLVVCTKEYIIVL